MNYMRETNVWMIRKMRWIFWGTIGFIPFYRNTYWDFLGRRVAWRDSLSGKTEEEKKAEAEALRGNWGYHPRYEVKYDFSIKTQKYAQQTPAERVRDTPRLRLHELKNHRDGFMSHEDVHTLTMIAKEHNRIPGKVNYDFPQTFYSTFPEIDQEAYVTLGSSNAKRVH